ncbi:MAG: oxygen-independent coproporphyrinogen III oxidase [Gammaproteobacteria bacterium]|nr:oxygen-independent coproporphyrinogen III oxidase [Gammaproteobacteria bacterium]
MTDKRSPSVRFDAELIQRYDKSGPRYTSYPTAVQFHEAFGADRYAAWTEHTNGEPIPRPLSLYFHIPFCDTVCFYCACNKIATKDRGKAVPYLDHLYREIQMQGALFDKDRSVDQLHWGGGTPTFISHQQMRELMQTTGEHFRLRDDDEGEYSIEIDPREADSDTVAMLREIGFNRMSLGVQDFDPQVQKGVNRLQSYDETMTVLQAARAEGFKSVSVDLIYGLPFQSAASFDRTLDLIIGAGPDRLSLFNYAHLPEIFKPQRRIDADSLPSAAEKLRILQLSIQRLTDAGYVFIGMDHFAKPDDELAVAQQRHTLYRNFQGYSTHANCDLIGMGITSIGMVGDTYSQNVKTLDAYYGSLERGELPIMRGVELDADDLLRRQVIMELICHFELTFDQIERAFEIRFDEYFQAELNELTQMQEDGLLTVDTGHIQVTPAGKLLIRNICMVFDRYLRAPSSGQRFSKVI